MAIREVLRLGNPILGQKASRITEFNTNELDVLIQDMQDTMQAKNGAGLAAPQIGVSQQLVLFGFTSNPRYPQAAPIPQTVLINPEIRPVGELITYDWEGCLSLPGLRGFVPRYDCIEYSGYDANGDQHTIKASGFHARVVQHECDHLIGILYPQRMDDLSKLGYVDELLEAGELQHVKQEQS